MAALGRRRRLLLSGAHDANMANVVPAQNRGYAESRERGWIDWSGVCMVDGYVDGLGVLDSDRGGSPEVFDVRQKKSHQHYVAAWRMLAEFASKARRQQQRQEVAACHRDRALRWRRLVGRIVRTRYWRSVGPLARTEQPVALRESWSMRDLIPSCVRRFGVEAARRVLAGRVTAAFLSLSPDEEGVGCERYHATAWDSFATWVSGGHRRRHRTTNRWVGRMALLRKLRERLIFGAEGIRRVRSPVNDAWCSIQARKLVSECVESGEIDGRHARWYRDALVTVFYLEDDDDVMFSAIGSVQGGRIY